MNDKTDPIAFVIFAEKDGLYDYVSTFTVNDPRFDPGAQDAAATRADAEQFALNYFESRAQSPTEVTPDDVAVYAVHAVTA